jgi:branched-chain amino acid aminotransferase
MLEALKKGGEACVLTDAEGNLTESAGSNVFLVKDGVVVTPSDGCLEGITRQTTFDLCEEFGIPCEVRKVGADELRNADEAFFTTTAGGIMPMGSVDGKDLGGKPGAGEISVRLHNAYWEKRWAGWHGEPVDYSLAAGS